MRETLSHPHPLPDPSATIAARPGLPPKRTTFWPKRSTEPIPGNTFLIPPTPYPYSSPQKPAPRLAFLRTFLALQGISLASQGTRMPLQKNRTALQGTRLFPHGTRPALQKNQSAPQRTRITPHKTQMAFHTVKCQLCSVKNHSGNL